MCLYDWNIFIFILVLGIFVGLLRIVRKEDCISCCSLLVVE